MQPAKVNILAARIGMAHPLWPTLITFLTLVAGITGSIYTKEVSQAFPLVLSGFQQPYRVEWKAVLFWGPALVATVLFFLRQCADDYSKAIAHGELVKRSETLIHLTRTLPPRAFLSSYAALLNFATEVSDTVFSPRVVRVERDQAEAALRHLLAIFATLAKQFDGADEEDRYAANVMLFRASSEMTPDERNAIQARLKFITPETSVELLRGVLDLQVEWSAVAGDEEARLDEELVPFALPIPHQTMHRDRYTILPGAPFAFVDKVPDIYADVTQMREWCDTFGDFTEQVKQQLEAFFRDNKNLQSLVSIPLPLSSDNPIGVLNLHADRANILRSDASPDSAGVSAADQFFSVVMPVCEMIGLCVHELRKRK